MPPCPCIEQSVGGAAVEAEGIACPPVGGGEQRYVRDPAEVDDRAPERGVGHDGVMEHGGQRCTLTAGCNVAPAEVCHGGDAGSLGDDIRIPDLGSRGPPSVGIMADGLAVTSHGGDLGPVEPGFPDGGERRVGEEVADLDIESGDAGEGCLFVCCDFQKIPAESGWYGMVVRVQDARGRGVRTKRGDDRVNGVDARAGDESQIKAGQLRSAIQAGELGGAEVVDSGHERPDRTPESVQFPRVEWRRPGKFHGQRVSMNAVDAKFIMKVRARCDPGRAYVPDDLTLSYPGPSSDPLCIARHMGVQGRIAVSMGEQDGFPIAALASGKRYATGPGGPDRRAPSRGIVHTAMRSLGPENRVQARLREPGTDAGKSERIAHELALEGPAIGSEVVGIAIRVGIPERADWLPRTL